VRRIEGEPGGPYRLAIKNEKGMRIIPVSVRFPKSWQGATPKQLLNSAEAILNQPAGGSEDPRFKAAKWVLEKFSPQKGGKERR